MISNTIEVLKSKTYFKSTLSVEITKGLYNKGGWLKKLIRYIKG